MHVYLNKHLKITFNNKKKYIIIFFKEQIFFKQNYIKNKDYTFFLIVLVLSKYGLLSFV
jgi:hypothetical protein